MKLFLYSLLALVSFSHSIFAQSPENLSYQAVVRNAAGEPLKNQQVGMQISILQGSNKGLEVFNEIHESMTNANGLVSIEIGKGNPVNGNFSEIDWASGPYFLKTETDPEGGLNYTITGTSQLLSVPYSLHSKTAEKLSGEIVENDPHFSKSLAAGITSTDTARWNIVPSDETDPVFSGSVAAKITAHNIMNWNMALSSEGDPVYKNSLAAGISEVDTARWNQKQDKIYVGDGIHIHKNTLSLQKQPFYLGQDTLGGIVFYIYLDQSRIQHGLIVSKTETTAKWQNTESTTNAIRSWDGKYNMNLMVDSPAKDWISSYFSSEWYLPSIDELAILCSNRYHANNTLNTLGYTLLSNDDYWSSTENNTNGAIAFWFGGGRASGNFSKTNTYSVRAIRAF